MDSYTKFPNKIFDALLRYKLTATQLLVVLYIIRNTNGWGKPQGDWISVSRMAQDIGVTRQNVSKAVNDLKKKGVLSVTDEDRKIRVMRVTNPKNWVETVTQTRHKHVTQTRHTKERKKKLGLELKSSAAAEDEWTDAKELLRGIEP